VVVSLAIALIQTNAWAMPLVDQRAENSISFGHTITPLGGGSAGQAFVPTVAEHVGVQLMLSNIVITPARDSGQLDLTLNVHEGSIGGSVVETVQVSLSGGNLLLQWVEFDFASPLMLNPGQTYVLELVSALGNGFWHRVSGTEMDPNRQAIYAGASREWSWGFRTLTPIPEPGTALLMALGLTGLGVLGRRAR